MFVFYCMSMQSCKYYLEELNEQPFICISQYKNNLLYYNYDKEKLLKFYL